MDADERIVDRLTKMLTDPDAWALSHESLECQVLNLLILLLEIRSENLVEFRQRYGEFVEKLTGMSARQPLHTDPYMERLRLELFADELRPFVESEVAK